MGFKDMIQNAVNIGSETKFEVRIGSGDITEMNYIQLGTYLVSNAQKIDFVKIVLRDE